MTYTKSSKPDIKIDVFSQNISISNLKKYSLAFKYNVGKYISTLIQYYSDNKELCEMGRIIECRSLHDRLTDEQLSHLMSHQDSTFDLDIRKKYFKESDHSKTFHGIIMPYLDKLLNDDISIKSIMNIGCNYEYIDSLLAMKYPKVEFIGVDVNKELDNLNSDLRSHNHRFIGGYALDIIEKRVCEPDVCYMSSTATVIRNQELKRYLKSLKQTTKYVMFNEPIWILPGDVVIDPCSISVDESKPSYVQRKPITNEYAYMCYIHNYKGLLEKAGFKPIVYKFYKPEFTYLYWIVVIGQNTDDALWEK